MTSNSSPNDSRGEIYINTVDSHFIVSQDRKGNVRRQMISMTLEEAKDVVQQLRRRIKLEEELQRTGLAEV